MGNVYYEDNIFKEKFVSSVEKVLDTIVGLNFSHNLTDIRNSTFVGDKDNFEITDLIIDEEEFIDLYFEKFNNENGEPIQIRQTDVLTLLDDLESGQLINDVEYFCPKLYLLRVDADTSGAENFVELMMFEAIYEEFKIAFYPDHYFHFSYKLFEQGHKNPAEHDNFIVIYGENLELATCRKIIKSFRFEVNSVYNIKLEPLPNTIFNYDDLIESYPEHVDSIETKRRHLIICDDTERVIDLYHKALSCEDSEVSIIFYSKVIEFVSETVVRTQITEEGRKILSSNRALNPDANFIKEIQEMFKNHSYQKDSESLRLTVQTCGYFKDIESLIPAYISKQVNKAMQQGHKEALGVIADSITATRNSIAHAKSNYRKTAKEVPPEQYDEFIEVLRIISQHCIRWYAAQSHVNRVI